MSWTAIVPIKPAAGRKSRLAACLSPADREALADRMFWHVISVLRSTQAVCDIVVLCEQPPAGWNGRSMRDEGHGLNLALGEACKVLDKKRILILHGDLPLLSAQDVDALIEGAECGSAIAPDRHLTGTNGLALRSPAAFPFSFGANSLAAHCVAERFALVQRLGLRLDIDTPDDLAVAQGLGFELSAPAVES